MGYQFGQKYWDIVDQDANGSLNFGEFKSAIAALAGSNARVAMKGFDADGDNMLNSAEQTAFYNKVIAIAQSWGYKVSDAQWAALKAAYPRPPLERAASQPSTLRSSRSSPETFSLTKLKFVK